MIQIFDIKKKKKYLNDNNVTLLNKYKKISNLSSNELVHYLNSNKDGLSSNEASKRLKEYGPNVVIKDDKKP